MSKKVSFNSDLPQDKPVQTRGMRDKSHQMSKQDEASFYTVQQENRMKLQARWAEKIIKDGFEQIISSTYSTQQVAQIMKNLDQKAEKLALQQQQKVGTLKRYQAKKYFLEMVVDQEVDRLSYGQNTTLLPVKTRRGSQQQTLTSINIKNIRNQETPVPFQSTDTYGSIKAKYGAINGIDPSRIKLICNGKIYKDTEVVNPSLILVALVKL
jgi:hypothetical protein